MEKYARQALSEGAKSDSELHVNEDSELYRVLNVHYNRNNHIEVRLIVSWIAKKILMMVNGERYWLILDLQNNKVSSFALFLCLIFSEDFDGAFVVGNEFALSFLMRMIFICTLSLLSLSLSKWR